MSRVLSRIDRRELLRFSLLQIEMHRGCSPPCRRVCARTSAQGAGSVCERPRRMPASTRPHWLLVLVRGFELFRLAKGHVAPSALRRSHPQSRLAKDARQAGQRQREQRLRNLCLDRDSPLRECVRTARRDFARTDARRDANLHNRDRAAMEAIVRRNRWPRREASHREVRGARRSKRHKSCRDPANSSVAPDRQSRPLFQRWRSRVPLSLAPCSPLPPCERNYLWISRPTLRWINRVIAERAVPG